MKANLDQSAGISAIADLPAKASTTSHKVSSVDPPVKRKTWFNSYDEEWAALLSENSRCKTRPGINNEIPEALPRVWNIPHG